MRTGTPEKGTISICFVNEALVCVRANGMDQSLLLSQAGIPLDLLGAPRARVSSRQYGQLWRLIAKTLDDEFFGMDEHPMKAGSFALLCRTVIHSDSLEQALHRALRFLRLILDGLSGELVRDEKYARIILHDKPTRAPGVFPAPKRAFTYGTFFVILHGLACWLVNRRIPLLSASFRCPEPDYSAELRAFLSPNLEFLCQTSAIAFDAEYLDMKIIQSERSMKEFLRDAPANFLVKYRDSASLTARIRQYLRETPPQEWPGLSALAGRYHLSAAALRRRLGGEGQSYRSIKNDMRRDIAISLLTDTDQRITDIAAALGFSESSAFYRAFKNWTGIRPNEYRSASRDTTSHA
ncbi:AraC family transcriptional regulator [Candidimonas nitroreducens]|uniref:AraC family transcriptional regulator n=2 Tax=Candidimonas nitroreducens TaxID=683354 RepID=A0A225MSG9_9BURK|nr:AraC family transcriptional regulator [Candidimonas nitroreducens]